MSAFFEEIDYQPTPIGPISLRRRHDFRLKTDILEIMLGDKHLMSDLFTTSEIALATLDLAYHREQDDNGRQLDVVVGGLGLGYTAEAVLCDKSVGSLWVVEALQAIINWHEAGCCRLAKFCVPIHDASSSAVISSPVPERMSALTHTDGSAL